MMESILNSLANNDLIQRFPNGLEGDTGKYKFSFDTTILEIEQFFNSRELLNQEIQHKIEIAPDKLFCLKTIIADIENDFDQLPAMWMDISDYSGISGDGAYVKMPMKEWPEVYLAYHLIKFGYQAKLKHFAHLYVTSTTINNVKTSWHLVPLWIEKFKKIGEGVAIAYLLPQLRNQFRQLEIIEKLNILVNGLDFNRKLSYLINDFKVSDTITNYEHTIRASPVSFQIDYLKKKTEHLKFHLFMNGRSLVEQQIIDDIINNQDYNLLEKRNELKEYFFKKFDYLKDQQGKLPNTDEFFNLFERIATDARIYSLLNDKMIALEAIAIVENIETHDISKIKNEKLKWLGTPAQFGFIIQELIGKGYIEKPTSSFVQDSNIYLSIFDIETTEGTLQKELSDKTNSISTENARQLQLPHINKLSRNNQKVAGK